MAIQLTGRSEVLVAEAVHRLRELCERVLKDEVEDQVEVVDQAATLPANIPFFDVVERDLVEAIYHTSRRGTGHVENDLPAESSELLAVAADAAVLAELEQENRPLADAIDVRESLLQMMGERPTRAKLRALAQQFFAHPDSRVRPPFVVIKRSGDIDVFQTIGHAEWILNREGALEVIAFDSVGQQLEPAKRGQRGDVERVVLRPTGIRQEDTLRALLASAIDARKSASTAELIRTATPSGWGRIWRRRRRADPTLTEALFGQRG